MLAIKLERDSDNEKLSHRERNLQYWPQTKAKSWTSEQHWPAEDHPTTPAEKAKSWTSEQHWPAEKEERNWPLPLP